jgi:hypothetical protein
MGRRVRDHVGNVSKSMVQHWDGASWTTVPSESPGVGLNDLNYVAVLPTGAAWAAGSYFNNPYNYRTLVEQVIYNCATN